MTVKTKCLLTAMAFFSCFCGWMPRGQTAGETGDVRISGCPRSPNCVSSSNTGGRHWIAPLTFNVTPDEAFHCIKEIIRRMKRATIVVDEEGYIHAEFRTALGFVDDVEFELDAGGRTILMRSASRMGYWDLGVNRRRLETLRALFDSKCK